MKQGILTRIKDDGFQTIGKFEFDDTVLCALERPWLGNMQNISSIPCGTYIVPWLYSTPKFPNGVYQVKGVPGRSGIDFHSANVVSALKGCIALGMDGVIKENGFYYLNHPKIAIEHIKIFFGTKDWELIIKNG